MRPRLAGADGARGADGAQGPAGPPARRAPRVPPVLPGRGSRRAAGPRGAPGLGLHPAGRVGGDGRRLDRRRRLNPAHLQGAAPPPPPPPEPRFGLVLNEIDYDQVGADSGGFVEITNTSIARLALDGVAIVLVNGGDGQEYERVALTGSLVAHGHLAIPVEAQNGAPDGVALVDTASGLLLDSLSYEGEINAAVIDGQTFDLVEGEPLRGGRLEHRRGSLSRIPDGEDRNNCGDRLGVRDDVDAGRGERRDRLAAHESPALRPPAPGAGALAACEPLLERGELALRARGSS